MKKLILVLTFISTMVQAQEVKQVPSISVTGEGKIKVTPDEAIISFGVENSGKDATEVKKKNDEIVDKVLKVIKKHKIPATDFQTERVSLFKTYDYNTKKNQFQASQNISIHLKDLNKYDGLMMDLVDAGVNAIQNVEFKSSKIKELESQARKDAILDAKKKAEDFVVVLNQKVGKAITISDNTQASYPRPMYKTYAMAAESADAGSNRQTLAIGEIEITTSVSVVFELQ
ncbi:MAG: SIMPL domain-containing protein [Flavobacteriaceae bacterium]|nr:SIMPL domain-containing protein [Flavobacteriaceae bacterium]